MSLSARRAWIEISGVDFAEDWLDVALRKESVDRNDIRHTTAPRPSVALRKESVDRNTPTASRRKATDMVALRKESVDRNAEDWLDAGCLPRSLSARRAWIEIKKY